jgi:hypothetical protein
MIVYQQVMIFFQRGPLSITPFFHLFQVKKSKKRRYTEGVLFGDIIGSYVQFFGTKNRYHRIWFIKFFRAVHAVKER